MNGVLICCYFSDVDVLSLSRNDVCKPTIWVLICCHFSVDIWQSLSRDDVPVNQLVHGFVLLLLVGVPVVKSGSDVCKPTTCVFVVTFRTWMCRR